jgi:glycosyltransferase EpsJ
MHKENGGAPSARNFAMNSAVGKYFYFIDADDWVEPKMLQDMYSLAEKYNSQLTITGFYIDTYYSNTKKFIQKQSVQSMNFLTKDEFHRNAYRLFDQNLLYTPWNKLYLADYIKSNKIVFPDTFWDDFPFNLTVIRDVERVCITSHCYYHFVRKRAESETARYRSDMYQKREDEHQWLLNLYKYWNIHDKASYEFLARRYIERLIGCVENVTNSDCNLQKAKKKIAVEKMINSSNAVAAVKIAKPRSAYMKAMLAPVRWKNTELTFLEGCFISKVRSKNTKLFAKLKANR